MLTFLDGPHDGSVHVPSDSLGVPIDGIVVRLDDTGVRRQVFDLSENTPKRLRILGIGSKYVCLPMVGVPS